MATIRELHDKAMELAEQAHQARRQGNWTVARPLFIEACELERQAAELSNEQPTTGILYRSAASLASSAGEYASSIAIAEAGLATAPHPEIRAELEIVIRIAKEKSNGNP